MVVSSGDFSLSSTIESVSDLVFWMESGCRPRSDFRIGTEHEKLGFRLSDHGPLPYGGACSVRSLLCGLRDDFGWDSIMEGDHIIGLRDGNGGSITLEPGGQFELSGAPLEHLHATCNEVNGHLSDIRSVCSSLGIGFMGIGFSPVWGLSETPMMPKRRYEIMRSYMPRVGGRGLDMMFRSCTVQVNLDFSDESDMRRKLRVGLALQPIVTALFSNSPFVDGGLSDYKSYRSYSWLDTDSSRTGMLPFVFDDGFGFESYVEYALSVPMYFLYRDGIYHDVSGCSFRDFLCGRLRGFEGLYPTFSDWNDHLTILFPEARLKHFIEMRGADSGSWHHLCALPALWVGLLYDDSSLDSALSLIRDWDVASRDRLYREVCHLGFSAEICGRSVLDIARDMVSLSRSGLKSRGFLDSFGSDERHFLDPLEEIIDSGFCPADDLVSLYHGLWGGDIDHVFDYCSY